jgi:two-component system response regulator GlrR
MTRSELITEDYVLQAKTVLPENGQGFWHENYGLSNQALKPLKDARDAFERDYLVQVLAMTEGNVSQAAKLAGKYRADFYDLLKKHDLKVEEFKRTKPTIPT